MSANYRNNNATKAASIGGLFHSPFLKALAEVRCLAARKGWRYQHVQAIIVAIDQSAEAATGNRDFFLNKPPGTTRGDVS